MHVWRLHANFSRTIKVQCFRIGDACLHFGLLECLAVPIRLGIEDLHTNQPVLILSSNACTCDML